MEQPKLKTNLDTDFLKFIAIISMALDHFGGEFFPQYPIFRWLGRLAFPLFCYCMTVGMLYTRDIKKYLLRLGIFAFISQPFWILAFNSQDFWGNLFNFNIFFTLLVSLTALWGAHTKKWRLFAAGFLALSFVNFDYSATGLILMLIFYYCRNKPALGAGLYILSYLPAFWNSSIDDPLALMVAGYPVGFEIFCLLALPLIYIPTHTNVKIPKRFFYWFYPAHLCAIWLLRR